MEKTINMQNGDVIIINSNLEGYDNSFTINKGYMENGEVKKVIIFKKSYNFLIDGWMVSNDETNILTYEFEESDPLYDYLNNLIGKQGIFILDDDLTREENKKFVSIKKENNKIVLSIVNNLNNNHSIDKFNVRVINTFKNDGISKIDYNQSDVRERLNKFFNDMQNDFLEQKVYKK